MDELWMELTLYLLALLNPPSKIMFLASYQPRLTRRQNWELSWKSSVAALLILLVLAWAGDWMLRRVFHVELYSLQITGGLVVFMIGWTAVREGRFFLRPHEEKEMDFTELSLVPLAAPLIAGPGMIAAVITATAEYGWGFVALALAAAVAVNFVLMLFAQGINRALQRVHLQGPLIRLTGLMIAAVAMQMILSGLHAWLR